MHITLSSSSRVVLWTTAKILATTVLNHGHVYKILLILLCSSYVCTRVRASMHTVVVCVPATRATS